MRSDAAKRLKPMTGVKLVDGRRGVIIAGPHRLVRHKPASGSSLVMEIHMDGGQKKLITGSDIEKKLDWSEDDVATFLSRR